MDSRSNTNSTSSNEHGAVGGLNGDIDMGEDAPPPPRVDSTPIRDGLETALDQVLDDLGRAPITAASARRRLAEHHLRQAADFVALRATGYHDDPRCRQVQAALAAQVRGSCERCGANFCVVPVVVEKKTDAMAVGNDKVYCGFCGERAQAPCPVVANPEQKKQEKWKGWLPWQ